MWLVNSEVSREASRDRSRFLVFPGDANTSSGRGEERGAPMLSSAVPSSPVPSAASGLSFPLQLHQPAQLRSLGTAALCCHP